MSLSTLKTINGIRQNEKQLYCESFMYWFYLLTDVRTQAIYQMMDEGFVGLIFSVFNEDKATKVRVLQKVRVQCLSYFVLENS